MPKAVLYVETRPSSPDREEEFNRWYDETHLGQVCALPGVTGARRYKGPEGAYVALYDLDTDDPASVVPALGAGFADGSITMSDALSMDPAPVVRLLEQIAEHRG